VTNIFPLRVCRPVSKRQSLGLMLDELMRLSSSFCVCLMLPVSVCTTDNCVSVQLSTKLPVLVSRCLRTERVTAGNDACRLGLTCSAHNTHLLLTDIHLVPGFTVTCNISNNHAYLLTSAAVTVLRKLLLSYFLIGQYFIRATVRKPVATSGQTKVHRVKPGRATHLKCKHPVQPRRHFHS